mgnify:FL=1
MGQSPDNATMQTLYNAIKSLIFKELNDYNSGNYPILIYPNYKSNHIHLRPK